MRKKIATILGIIFYAGIFSTVFAAEVRIDPGASYVGTGDKVEAIIVLDTEGDSLNALEGSLSYPSDVLAVKEIRDGNSVFSFWIKKPIQQGNRISFAAGVPGGLNDHSAKVFSVIFQALRPGYASVMVQDVRALKNDSIATPAIAKTSGLKITIGQESGFSNYFEPEDSVPPEPFIPELNRDSRIYGGKWFLAFYTVDKSSGIDHYEVNESAISNAWVRAEMPYLLKDQSLKSIISVKSIDKSGNERIERLPPYSRVAWYQKGLVWIIIAILTTVFLVMQFKTKKWQRNRINPS